MTDTRIATDEAQIRQVLAGQEAGMRSGDAEALIARYAPDVVVFSLAPPLGSSGAAARDVEGLRRWFAGFAGPMHFDITDLSVTVGGDVAYCHSLNRMGATPAGSPDGFEMWFRATVCLQRIDGRWLVTHEHTSTPFYMDGSFRAATDLKP
jgi:ketosteroid isomerase-like protein